MEVPVLIGVPGLYYGGIVTPDGFKFIFSDKLPDNYIAYAHIPFRVFVPDLESFMSTVYPGAKYEVDEFRWTHNLTIVKYTDIDSLKRMILNAKGYSCHILELVGANLVKVTPEAVRIYDVYGTIVYCTGLGIGLTVDNVAYSNLYPACYEYSSPSIKFEIKNGKIYYNGKLVVDGIDLDALDKANPEVVLSYENLFQILCLMARNNA